MLVKVHNSYRQVIAICDSDLLGKKFQEDKKSLEINEHFFNGQETSEKETLNIIEKGLYEDATFNIVGQNSVKLAIQAGIIKPEHVLKVQDIPIALSLL